MKSLDEVVVERLAAVRRRIVAAAGGLGRDVEVVAVTKTFGVEAVWAAYRAGCIAIGENYAQETVDKLAGLTRPFRVHFIGQLQSNKVRRLAGLVDVYETVDRSSIASEIARRAPGAEVLVQVDTTGEPGKGGCRVADVGALVAEARDCGLKVSGLMTVGPTTGGAEAARDGFRRVRALVDELGLTVCSMGMSGDFEVAVEEGSNQVRIGSALFGERRPLN
ncbi:MAG: YggS family pyridoxal phosphate-dependent enzyme [Ilumatobacteraceae bacterium]